MKVVKEYSISPRPGFCQVCVFLIEQYQLDTKNKNWKTVKEVEKIFTLHREREHYGEI